LERIRGFHDYALYKFTFTFTLRLDSSCSGLALDDDDDDDDDDEVAHQLLMLASSIAVLSPAMLSVFLLETPTLVTFPAQFKVEFGCCVDRYFRRVAGDQ